MGKGKIKRFLKERCPECGKVLQVRVLNVESMFEGEKISVSQEYIACSNCEYERSMEQKRYRRQEEILF
jgi:hypothetical protein